MSEITEKSAVAGYASNGAHAITTASAKVLSANASRAGFRMTNDGAGDVWLSYGVADAVAHQGHFLKGGGGVMVEDEWNGEVHAIASAATNVCFIETAYSVGDDQGEQPTGSSSFVPSGPGDTAPMSASIPQTAPPPNPGRI